MWEYKIEYLYDNNLEEALNAFGQDRWECFHLEAEKTLKQQYEEEWVETTYIIYLKRQII